MDDREWKQLVSLRHGCTSRVCPWIASCHTDKYTHHYQGTWVQNVIRILTWETAVKCNSVGEKRKRRSDSRTSLLYQKDNLLVEPLPTSRFWSTWWPLQPRCSLISSQQDRILGSANVVARSRGRATALGPHNTQHTTHNPQSTTTPPSSSLLCTRTPPPHPSLLCPSSSPPPTHPPSLLPSTHTITVTITPFVHCTVGSFGPFLQPFQKQAQEELLLLIVLCSCPPFYVYGVLFF